MTEDDRRRAILAFLALHPELSPGGLEKAGKMGDGALRKYLEAEGESRTITERTLRRLVAGATKILGREVLPTELGVAGESLRPTGETSRIEQQIVSVEPNSERADRLLLYRLVHGAERGAFMLKSSSVRSEIPRTAGLSRAAFACRLLDSANAPGYAAGHTVVVDPDVGAIPGDFCLFTAGPASEQGQPTRAGVLRDVDETHWTLTQNAEPEPIRLSREEYPHAWPVVAHYPRGYFP